MTARMMALVLLIAGGSSVSSGPQAATGSVGGSVTDRTGGVLPGVEVSVSAGATTIQAVTDARGQFLFRNVASGKATVEARLAGFKTQRVTDVIVESGHEARIDISMCVSALAEILWVMPPSYTHLLQQAHAVLHLKITGTVPFPSGCDYDGWLHTATILHSVKSPGELDGASTVTFFQERWADEQTPYPIASELVLPLSKMEKRYARICGPFGVFIVTGQTVNPQVRSGSFGTSDYGGMKLQDFLTQLERILE